jgi:heme exporter protein A
MAETLLDVRSVSCEREGRQLFSDLDLIVEAGSCVELTGPNGSGKSTLLRCIAGFFPDFDGEIRAADIAYLGHRPGVSPALTPLENLKWYRSLVRADADPVTLIERVGLAGYEEVICQHLSAGQQRRVALARLMLGGGPLWLLDEPFTALDASGTELVRTVIGEHLQAGGAALCATHQPLSVPGSRTLMLGGATDEVTG